MKARTKAYRYVAIAPTRIDDRKAIGPASYLHEFLVDHQTDAEGHVNYRRPISYAWIRSKWQYAPPLRTLKRHMARLKTTGDVFVRVLPFGQGMKVRVIGSAKWPQQPAQASLFPQVVPVPISGMKRQRSCGKPVEKPVESTLSMGPKVAPVRCQKWPRNELRKNLKKRAVAFGQRLGYLEAAVENPERQRQTAKGP